MRPLPEPQAGRLPDGSGGRWTLRVGLTIVGGWMLMALVGPLLAPDEATRRALDVTRTSSLSFLPPLTGGWLEARPGGQGYVFRPSSAGAPPRDALTHRFWLGTDRVGQDLALAIARGARTSFLVGILAALLATGLGIVVGAVAGLGAGWVDAALMRLVDALLAFPLLLLVLLLDLLFDPGLATLILLLGVSQWMGVARIARAEMRRLRGLPFVEAARGVGSDGIDLFARHLLPHALPPILVSSLLLVGDSILLESALSFLGFGTAGDLPSWGGLVDAGRPFLLDAWWISTFPGIAIVAVVAACNLLGDELQQRYGSPTAG